MGELVADWILLKIYEQINQMMAEQKNAARMDDKFL